MKRKKWYGILLTGLFVCLALPVFAGGNQANTGSSAAGTVSNSAANVNAPGVYPICKTPITLDIGIRQNTSVENYDTNYYTKMLEDKGNMTLTFDIFPSGNPGTEKLMVMVSGGATLPEVLVDFSFADDVMLNLGQEGVAIPLNDYYQNWAYEFPKQIQKVTNKAMWNWMHSADGNVYYVPFIQEQLGEYYSLRGWINQSWLDKLGLQTPVTTDDFRNVLTAFRDRDPNGNGKKDEIP
ncbi:MAG: extracellular solute-binding protein, partial [Treponema sp.]|nr:extracellular solute-binding protein [Treponema sp.]